jgi:hypothetical protein
MSPTGGGGKMRRRGGGLAVPSPLLTRIFFAYCVDHHDTICDWLAAGDII